MARAVLEDAARADSAAAGPEEIDAAAESTLALCQLVDHAKAELLRVELWESGVPCWTRWVPLNPLTLTSSENALEFRVPARDVEAARAVLRRIDEQAHGRPIEDEDPPA